LEVFCGDVPEINLNFETLKSWQLQNVQHVRRVSRLSVSCNEYTPAIIRLTQLMQAIKIVGTCQNTYFPCTTGSERGSSCTMVYLWE